MTRKSATHLIANYPYYTVTKSQFGAGKQAKVTKALILAVCALLTTACGPNEKQRAEFAEAKRIECLDKFCEGDVEPKRNMATEVAFKRFGQWYVMPKAYGAMGTMQFWWWEHKSVSNLEIGPELQARLVDGKSYDHLIEIFLTSRHRWPEPNAVEPWQGRGWEGRFEELQKQGLRVEREKLNAGLERVRFFDSNGVQYRHEYFLATGQSKALGIGEPGVACDSVVKSKVNQQPGCTGGEFWQPDIYADFRFSAKHAKDWPTIHQEITRVLNLAKKVQP